VSASRFADLPDDALIGQLRAGIAQAPESELLAAADTLAAITGSTAADLAPAAYDWRALTVRQPWAAAIVHGPKNIENRTQQTHRRGPVLIHAARQLDKVGERGYPAVHLRQWMRSGHAPADWVLGAIVGVAEVVDCHPAKPWWRGGCCAPWGESGPDTEAVWHWVLASRRALREPVPARGALGFWRPPADVLAAALDQLGGTS